MKRFIFLVMVLLGLSTLIACEKTPDEIFLTGINLSGAAGQGTVDDPFTFSVTADDDISANITIAPADVVADLTFEFVEKTATGYSDLDQSAVTGITFNSDNGSNKFSVNAVTEGTYYIRISQDEVSVYVKVTVEAKVVEPEPIDFTENLKVLAIGNSFSEDGMAYLYQIAEDYGVENIVLGNLYIGGAELSQHATNIATNEKAYTYRKNDTGTWNSTASQSVLDGLLDEEWDIITIQQVSGKSGRSEFYEPYLTQLIDYVEENKTNEDARVLWHMTWAYQSDSSHGEFPYYQSDQMTMYNAILNTYETVVAPKTELSGVIPAGTAIQNLRTSYVGDTVTRDGYHLSLSLGRYTAGMTWFKAITNLELDDITYRPSGVTADDVATIKEAVNNAVAHPFEVTESTFKDENGNGNNDELSVFPIDYVIGYWYPTTHNINQNAANHINFVASDVRFSKEELPVGTTFEIESGYQFRIVYFTNLDGLLDGNIRTENLRDTVVVDELFWGDFEYIGINVSPTSTTDVTTMIDTVGSKLVVSVPYEIKVEVPHVDQALSFESGYWNDGQTAITPGTTDFSQGFAASNPISKAYYDNYASLTIADGYQVRFIFYTYDGYGEYTVAYRSANATGTHVLDSEFWGSYEYLGFNISSVPSTNLSTVLEDLPALITLEETLVDQFTHEDTDLSFVSGYWASGSKTPTLGTDSFSKGFLASNVLSRVAVPVGTKITIADGYVLRISFVTFSAQTGYEVVSRTDNFSNEIVILTSMYQDYEYIAFNIAASPSADISELAATAATTLVTFEEFSDPIIEHVDQPLTYNTGFYLSSRITPDTTSSNAVQFIYSNILSKANFTANTSMVIEDGYQVRVVFIDYEFNIYTVLLRTDNYTGTVLFDDAFWGDYEYVAFNISSTDYRDISQEVEVVSTKVTFASVEEIPHVDMPLTFLSGYWYDNKTEIDPGVDAFSKNFAATNALSKAYFDDYESITIADGYQVRFVFFTYDGYGEYRVAYRTPNSTGVNVLDETFWGEYEYLGFNLSSTPYTDLSEELDNLSPFITFDEELTEIYTHEDTDLSFISGYWAGGSTSPTLGTDSFSKGFLASNVLSRVAVPVGTKITIADGYVLRISFVTFSEQTGYKVGTRTGNFSNEIVILTSMYQDYEYIAFNIAASPSTDISELAATAATTLVTFETFSDPIIDHVNQPLTYNTGFYVSSSSTPDTTSSNAVQFIYSNILSKANFTANTSMVIEDGYQVRVIFMDYEFNIYTVLLRTDNYTGTVLFDDAFWGDYEYVAFNISSTDYQDISQEVAVVSTKVTFTDPK